MADKNLELITGILMHTSSFYFYYFPSHFTRSLSISALFLFYLTYFSGFLLPFPFISLPLSLSLSGQSIFILSNPLSFSPHLYLLSFGGANATTANQQNVMTSALFFSLFLSPPLLTHTHPHAHSLPKFTCICTPVTPPPPPFSYSYSSSLCFI